MLEIIELNGTNLELTEDLKKYITKKVTRLDKFLPRHARKSATARVLLTDGKGKKVSSTCEVILEVPNDTIVAKETTKNMFSSVDVVERKLANQLRKYKALHSNDRGRRAIRRFLGKAKRSR